VFVLLSIDARIGLWLLTQELHQRPLACILARFVGAMVPSQIEAWEPSISVVAAAFRRSQNDT
jgi:hypothetical protein